DRMHLVDISHRAIFLGEIADLREWRDVAVHGIEALAGDQLGPIRSGRDQKRFEMPNVAVAEDHAVAAGLAYALDHRIVVEGVRENEAVRDEPGDGRNAGLVRDVARREQERGFLAVKIRQFRLELHQGMVGAGDIAGAAGAGADAGRGLDHGSDYFRMLAHAEIVVGAPDHDIACPLRGMPHRVGKPAGDALEICEYAVAAFVMESAEGGIEKLAVIHRKAWNRRGVWTPFRAFPAWLSSRNRGPGCLPA